MAAKRPQQLLPLLLPLLLLLSVADGQRRLSQSEMKSLIKLEDFNYNSGQRHECSYLEKPADAYSGGGATDRYNLECCAGRQYDICGGRRANFQRRCCPGFARFTDINGASQCRERILADREPTDWLGGERPALPGVARFVGSFVRSPQVSGVLSSGRPSNATWTLLVVPDESFDASGFLSFIKCSNDSIAKALQATPVPGSARSGASASKVMEGSTVHRAMIYQKKCEQLESSNASGSLDLREEAWKHIIPGRKYIADLQREDSVISLHRTESGEPYPLKFSRYSTGVACIECAPIVEANHEAVNAVIHVIGKSLVSGSPSASLGSLLRSRFPDFWSLLPESERSLLNASIAACGAFHTVLIPTRLDELRSLSGELRESTLRRHIVRGLWCSAGMLDAVTQPVATIAPGENLRFACDASSRRLVQLGDSGGSQVVLSSQAGQFDIMAANGVAHVIDRPILPAAATSLMTALQEDSAELLRLERQTDGLAVRLLQECRLEFRSDRGYMLLLPTDAAFRKFLSRRSSFPEAAAFDDSRESRCALLRHHVLETEPGLTCLGRAAHLQRTYRTLGGDRLTDFLFVKSNVLKAFFMNAEVLHSAEGHEFLNGHIYHVKEVLLPSSSPVWANLIQRLYPDQQRIIANFRALASSTPGDRLMTLFLPVTGYEALNDPDTLKRHTADTVFYLAYLSGEVESIDLASLHSGSSIAVTREAGEYFAASGLGAARRKVSLSDCGARLPEGIICSLRRPLTPSTLSELP